MTTHEKTYTTPVTETLKQHVSIRKHNGEPIPDSMLREILSAARRSPTSSNMQAYSFVVVRNPETKEKLSELAGGQAHIRTCDTFVAICADISRLAQAAAMHGQTLAKNLENTMVATVDAAIAGMSLATAAESFGLGTVMIGAMRNHPAQVGDVLNLPQGVFVVYGMCIGWYDDEQRPPQKPRLPEELVIHYEAYDDSDPTDTLSAHDAELAAHYQALGRNLNEAAWTGVMADKFSTPRREHLRATLEAMGFVFD
jgi:FMN reductase (NADPH)